MFPLICANAKWVFEGIAEERAVGDMVAHDMARRAEGGFEAKREGAYINSLGSPSSGLLSFSGNILGRTRARLLLPL